MPTRTQTGPGGTEVTTETEFYRDENGEFVTDENGKKKERPVKRTTKSDETPPDFEKEETWEYDNGNLKKHTVKRTTRKAGGGNPKGKSVSVFEYETVGGVTRETKATVTNEDLDGNFTGSQTMTFEYWPDGSLKRTTVVNEYPEPKGEDQENGETAPHDPILSKVGGRFIDLLCEIARARDI